MITSFLVAFTVFVEVIIKRGRLEGTVFYVQHNILIIRFNGAIPKTGSFQLLADCPFGKAQ